MKRTIYFFYAFLFSSGLFAQQDSLLHFSLEGFVTEMESKKVLAGATVKLVGSDNTSFELKTDAKGYYRFEAHGIYQYINPNTSYVVGASGIDVKTPDFPDGIFGNPKAKISTVNVKESTNYRQDFTLKRIWACGTPMPLVVFKENSAEYFNTSMADSVLDFSKVMAGNPNIVVKITGHAGVKEEDAKKLAVKRAEVVKAQLMKYGIVPERLIASGMVDSDSLLKEVQGRDIRYYPGVLRQQLQTRIVYSIIRKDFITGEQPQIKVSTTGEEGEE